MKEIIFKIKSNALFSNVNEEEIIKYEKTINYTVSEYEKGQIIAQEDDKCSSIGLVLDGIVSIERIYPSGKGIVMKKLKVGDVFGEALIFSKTTTYPVTVIAVSRCTVLYLNKEELMKLFSLNDEILKNFMSLLSDKVVTLNNKIKSISLKSVKEKVVDYILQEYAIQKNYEIRLNHSKEEIAAVIGIPRPSFSRELIKLREENIIEFNRNTITIVDINKLETILFT